MLNEKSLSNLKGVNPLLVSVFGAAAAICPIEFQITEGVRSIQRQEFLVDSGKSKTLNSYHLIQKDGYGAAGDIVVLIDGVASWHFDDYKQVSNSVKIAAQQLGAKITWGGDFPTFKDGCHFQLEKGK